MNRETNVKITELVESFSNLSLDVALSTPIKHLDAAAPLHACRIAVSIAYLMPFLLYSATGLMHIQPLAFPGMVQTICTQEGITKIHIVGSNK